MKYTWWWGEVLKLVWGLLIHTKISFLSMYNSICLLIWPNTGDIWGFWGSNCYFWGVRGRLEIVLGYTHVYCQLLFSQYGLILTLSYRVIFFYGLTDGPTRALIEAPPPELKNVRMFWKFDIHISCMKFHIFVDFLCKFKVAS